MLTGDLVRFRVSGGFVSPRYITRKQADRYLPICETLIRTFRDHIGRRRTDLLDVLGSLEGERIDFKIIRGFVKLLDETCEFGPEKEMDYPAFRERVFCLSQARQPIVSRPDLIHKTTRDSVLLEIAEEIRMTPEELDSALYSDLPWNQVMISFRDTYTPESLLKRYNVALAQGLLYRARSLRIRVQGDYRVVFQYLKLARLMHWIRPADPGYEIWIDGPASLFSNIERYGVRMAQFLPGLLLARQWDMSADIAVRGDVRTFHLDSSCGLTSHYSGLPPFDSKIEESFFNKYTKKPRTWMIEREGGVLNFGQEVMIPDFTFRHPDGRKVHLEIVGFWTPEYLKKKIEKISKAAGTPLLVAVNRILNCGRDDFPCDVIFFRTGIRLRDVIDRLG